MPQLTEEEWKRVLPLLSNIKPERQQAAYNRLVKGMTMAKSGELYGYSRQDVNIIVNRVLDKHTKLASMPDKPKPPRGWVALEFFIPRSQVEEVRRVVEAMCPQPSAEPAKEKGPVRVRTRSRK
jgi:hypothetical protein